MIHRIAVVGNACAGKTTLSRKLAIIHQLPLTHVDSIQFLPGMKIRPRPQAVELLNKVEETEKWLIEGYGPFEMIEKRFQLATHIVFIDLPLWRLLWWATKRQLSRPWKKREELPEGCNEFGLAQTKKLFKTILKMNEKMRPQLHRFFSHESLRPKMIHIRSYSDWNKVFKNGVNSQTAPSACGFDQN